MSKMKDHYIYLLEKAEEAGKKLYPNSLVFGNRELGHPQVLNAPPSVSWETPEVGEFSLHDLMEDASVNDHLFGTWDYVFFPISGKEPMDVADTVRMDDPSVYDTDGKCYFYSAVANTIFIMSKE